MTEAIQLIREEFLKQLENRLEEWPTLQKSIINSFDRATAAALKRWNEQRTARIDAMIRGDE
jgi:hypothetical protein